MKKVFLLFSTAITARRLQGSGLPWDEIENSSMESVLNDLFEPNGLEDKNWENLDEDKLIEDVINNMNIAPESKKNQQNLFDLLARHKLEHKKLDDQYGQLEMKAKAVEQERIEALAQVKHHREKLAALKKQGSDRTAELKAEIALLR